MKPYTGTIQDFVRMLKVLFDDLDSGQLYDKLEAIKVLLGGTPEGGAPGDPTIFDLIKGDTASIVTNTDGIETKLDTVHTDLGTLQLAASLAGITLPGTYFSPADFTTTYSSATQIACTNTNGFTIDDSQCFVLSVMVKSSTGTWKKYINTANGVSLSASSGTITISGHTDTAFAATDLAYRVAINYQQKAFDPSTNANNVNVLNPEYTHYVGTQSIDEDNIGAQNTIYYSRYAYDMTEYKNMTLSYLLTGDDAHNTVTLKVYATLKPDYTLPATSAAIADTDEIFNISQSVLGDAGGIVATGATVGGIAFIDTPSRCEAIIIELKYVEDNTAAPGNAADVRVLIY